MGSDPLQERFDFAAGLIAEAGELALGYFQRLDSLNVRSKGPQDMASEADLNTDVSNCGGCRAACVAGPQATSR